MMNLKHTLERFRWIKALFSPFTPFKVKWYVGKTQVGIPYFYPRKWVKATPRLATKAALEHIEKEKRYNELNPENNSPELFARKGVTQFPETPPGLPTDPLFAFPAVLLIYILPPF